MSPSRSRGAIAFGPAQAQVQARRRALWQYCARRVSRGDQGQDWHHRGGEDVDDGERRLETEGTKGHGLFDARATRFLCRRLRTLGEHGQPHPGQRCFRPAHRQRVTRLQRGLDHNRRVEGHKLHRERLCFWAPHLPNDCSTNMLDIMPSNIQNADELLLLNHVLPDEALRHSMVVCKRGAGFGFTVGRANNVFSFMRTRLRDDGLVQISKHWPILSHERDSDDFAQKSDSGSAVVNASGHAGGLITSDAGSADGTDIVYATPAAYFLNRMEANGLHPGPSEMAFR